jgi:hypothetical protein
VCAGTARRAGLDGDITGLPRQLGSKSMLVARLLLVGVLLLTLNAPALSGPAAQATRVGGEAYALAVGIPSQPVDGAPYVALPPEGGTASGFSAGTGVGTGGEVGTLDGLRVTTTGELVGDGGTVTSTAEVEFVELFAGLVRATNARVSATSTVGDGRASSSGSVTFSSLTVAGLDYTDAVPNERVDLPGVGYIVLKEEIIGGDGQTTTSIIVRAFRLQVTELNVLGVPQGTEFVVANASSGLPEISATLVIAGGATPVPTLARYQAISTRDPLDVSIGDRGDELVGDFFDNDNFGEGDNDDNGGVVAGGAGDGAATGAAAGTGARAAGPSSPVVVTVVVVVATPTPGRPGARSATATRTPTPRPPTRTPTRAPTRTPTPRQR